MVHTARSITSGMSAYLAQRPDSVNRKRVEIGSATSIPVTHCFRPQHLHSKTQVDMVHTARSITSGMSAYLAQRPDSVKSLLVQIGSATSIPVTHCFRPQHLHSKTQVDMLHTARSITSGMSAYLAQRPDS